MRAVRSFDPCLPCGVHMYLGEGRTLEKVHSPTQAPDLDWRPLCDGGPLQPLQTRGRPDRGRARRPRRVASAARHGDQLAAVIVDAHAAGFRRLLAAGRRSGGAHRRSRAGRGAVGPRGGRSTASAIDTMGARIDTLRSSIEQCGVPGLVDAADALIDAVTELHGWALGRAVDCSTTAVGPTCCGRPSTTSSIAALLLAHGMHPEPLAERVATGAGGVRARRSGRARPARSSWSRPPRTRPGSGCAISGGDERSGGGRA